MAAGLSFLAGRASVDPPSPAPQPTRTVVQEKEVERRVEVTVPYVPSQCKEAISLAQELQQLVDQYEAEFGKEDDILSDGHLAITDKDINELNAVVQRQINLKNATIGILLEIREKRDSLDRSLKQCSTRVTR